MKRFSTIIVLFVGGLMFPTGLLAAEGAHEARKLLLNVGPVDTTQLENLVTARPVAFSTERPHVIQLDGPMTPERQAALRAVGIIPGEYLPNHAYVVDVKGVATNAFDRIPFVVWSGEFRNEWKIDPELGTRAHSTPERQAMAARGEIPVIITLFAHHGAGKAMDAIAALQGVQLHYVEDEGGTLVLSATIRMNDAVSLSAVADIHYIEEAPEITLRNSTTNWIIQTNVSANTSIWAHGITGTGQVCGHMDGQVNMSHCAFFDPVNNTPGPAHRKVVGYNEALGYNQHGTHTADTAAGFDYNGSTGNTRGMAYGGKLTHSAIPAFSDTGFYNAAQTQYGQGARLYTNSWGNDGTTNYDGLCRGVDRFSYDFEEALVQFAVTNLSALKNPENAKNLLAVGGSQDTPNQANFCTGGSGPTVDGRRKPEIYAPGCSTNSASGSGSVCTTAALTGTSMASPAVTGGGMLVRQYFVDGFYPTGAAVPVNGFTPSGALIKATLLNSAVDMTGIAGFPSNQEGWGRLLLENGLYFTGDARKLVVPADIRNASGMSTGQQLQYNINVLGSSQSFKATLVWTEPPASASTGAGNPVINDLDLEVVDPSSNLYKGNVFTAGVSTTGGTRDAKNNVEMVLLNSPAIGSWTVRVKAAAVTSGLQGFALVVTGDVSSQAPAPVVSSIVPNSGASGGPVAITALNGSNFQVSGTTVVKLKKIGQPDIAATGVNVGSTALITCNFDLTAAEAGAWDVEVTNPDAQVGTLAASFTVTVTCTKGDVNRDGMIDGLDIGRFSEIYVTGVGLPVERCAGDVEAIPDGQIGDNDVASFVDCVLQGGCP